MQITNVQQIYDWSLKKRSVFISSQGCWTGIKPASWVISMQARTVCDLVTRGVVYYCVKKEDFDE